jgi:hypothetical protein
MCPLNMTLIDYPQRLDALNGLCYYRLYSYRND